MQLCMFTVYKCIFLSIGLHESVSNSKDPVISSSIPYVTLSLTRFEVRVNLTSTSTFRGLETQLPNVATEANKARAILYQSSPRPREYLRFLNVKRC
jgi:hypothetical protein